MEQTTEKKQAIFYGWWIVLGGWLCMFVGGAAMFSLSIFMPPLMKEYGWTREMLSQAYALNLVMMAVSGLIVGLLVEKKGPRLIVLLGAILGGTGVAMLSQVSQPWHFIVIYGVWVPVGINLGFANPALATVRRWFMKKAGITMALVMTGSGLGIAILLPLSAALIQAVGWRSSYVIMGAMVFVGCLVAAYLYRTSPETEGTYPDGEEPDPDELAARTDFMARMERWSLKEAVSVVPFWLVILGQAGILFTFMGLMGHMVTWAAVDLGTPFQKAAMLMTAFLLTATVSRLIGGWLSDWTMNKLGWTRKGLLYIGHAGVIGGTIMCATVVESFDMLVLAVAIMGFFYGALMPIFQVWLGDLFGVVSIPSLMVAIGIFTAGFSALGPVLFAWSHGATGYYDLAFWVCAGLLALSIICIWLIKQPRKG